ncbi:MAG: leucine-rich repeat domain-containing protein [Bacteroidaceae bacterium]|nr:leucine-rich repeat domain-containing protein [Bacteroidaceae bacterium]
MKKILTYALGTALLVLGACTTSYDDIALWNMTQDMGTRLTTLEELCAQMNSNIGQLQEIVDAVKDKDFIESVAPITFNGKEIGYTINFVNRSPITIYHGSNGTDGTTPTIGVKKDADGVYYWTVNGEWLYDNGKKVKAQGKDGKDGTNGTNGKDGKDGKDGTDGKDGKDGTDGKDGVDGKDGQDGLTPTLEIRDGYWWVIIGDTETNLGKATGEDGKDGKDGVDGKDGHDGRDGVDGKDGQDGVFQSLAYSEDGSYVIITLTDGTTIELPTWAAFQRLQELCNKANSDIVALRTIVEALQTNEYIQSITPLMEDGEEVGYVIAFGTHDPITIRHGKDGKDGTDGKDAIAPSISVKQDEDGIFYWTINGEWLTDSEGNKVKAQGVDGNDGNDGHDGTNGEDGITPMLKIEDDYWYVSVDEGETWENLGKAKGEDGESESMFQSITQDNDYAYFTLSDGTVITLPKGLKLSISFSQSQDIAIVPDKTTSINYTITNGGENPLVKVMSESTLTATITKETASTGVITVSCPIEEPENMEMVVYVSNGSQTCMEELTFIVNEDAELLIPDSQFKSYLLKTCDMDADGTLTLKDARTYNAMSTINRTFNISSSVSNLDGIQYFDIDSLVCDYCNLSTLDVSKNHNLTTLRCSNNKLSELKLGNGITSLDCSSNQLTTLDVTGLSNLRELYCTNNRLESINLNHNIHLDALDCRNNSITRLSLSQNKELTSVNCNNNLLVWLDVTKNTKLNFLSCNYNKLQNLDLGYANKELESLMCANNQLTSLNVIYFTSLKTLNCANNQIAELNLSKNSALTQLWCQNNVLTTLDVSKTNLTGSISNYPLYCKMSSLTVLYLKTGWEIGGINLNRSDKYIDPATEVEFLD